MAVFLPEIYLLSPFKGLQHAHPHKELTSFVKNVIKITCAKYSSIWFSSTAVEN
jgi:flagellar biosynthesis protein FlhB